MHEKADENWNAKDHATGPMYVWYVNSDSTVKKYIFFL